MVSIYTPVKPHIKPQGTFGETRRILYNSAMWLTRLTSTVLFLIGVMAVTAGCSTVDTTQNATSDTLALQSKDDSSSESVDRVTDTLGGYYDETVSYLTDSCGVGGYTVAAGKATLYGVGGGLWGASKGSVWGVTAGDSIEGIVIGSIVGSTVGLAVGVKKAYDGFESDTAGCDESYGERL